MGRRLALAAALVLALVPGRVDADCRPYPVGPDSPTGIVGCEVYGEGIASQWGGPGVARNDCEWPWDDCQPIRITVIETGAWIDVTPTMFCDCYTGTADERIVDLDPPTLAALGLDASRGLHRVRVEPIGIPILDTPTLPDTAMEES